MAGVAGFAVVDATYVFQITSGTFVPGGALQALSAVATGLIAVAGHIPGKVSGRSGRAPLPHLLLPTTFALIALAVISWEQLAPLPTLSVALAVAALLIAILRTHLSYRLVQSAAIHHREARTDELTHLANRRAFNETVSRVLHLRADHQSLALLIVDLDDFKQVNDTLGHHRGDELLIQVADRLQHSLRSGDLLARIGGDEFAVLIDGATEALAADVAERLRAGINTPYRVARMMSERPRASGSRCSPTTAGTRTNSSRAPTSRCTTRSSPVSGRASSPANSIGPTGRGWRPSPGSTPPSPTMR